MLALYYNISTEFGSASQIYLKKTEKKGAGGVGEDDKKEIRQTIYKHIMSLYMKILLHTYTFIRQFYNFFSLLRKGLKMHRLASFT